MPLLFWALTLSVILASGADSTSLPASTTPIEIKGVAKNMGRLERDGQVDLAMIFPALTWLDVVQFEAADMISPEADELKVVTERMDIPSNVSLPEQKERHIIPITIKKPVYRLFVPRAGLYRIAATHGQFPLKPVIKEIKNGSSFFDVLNYCQFFSAGYVDLEIQSNISGVDIAVGQIKFDETVTVKAPAFDPALTMVSVPLVEEDTYYIPSDIKQLTPNETLKLRIASSHTKKFVTSVLLSQEEADKIDRMYFEKFRLNTTEDNFLGSLSRSLRLLLKPQFNSGGGFSLVIQEAKGVVTPQFLPLVDRPILTTQELLLDVPTLPANLTPVGLYFILSEVESIPNGALGAERRTRLWESFEHTWRDRYPLPATLPVLEKDKKYRWDVLFLAGEAGQAPDPDGYFLDDVTHVTRNSVDFKF